MEIFSKRLKELRVERNITQQQLAEICGLKRVAVSGWENRNREPDFEILVLLAKFFDVSVDFLLGLEN